MDKQIIQVNKEDLNDLFSRFSASNFASTSQWFSQFSKKQEEHTIELVKIRDSMEASVKSITDRQDRQNGSLNKHDTRIGCLEETKTWQKGWLKGIAISVGAIGLLSGYIWISETSRVGNIETLLNNHVQAKEK